MAAVALVLLAGAETVAAPRPVEAPREHRTGVKVRLQMPPRGTTRRTRVTFHVARHVRRVHIQLRVRRRDGRYGPAIEIDQAGVVVGASGKRLAAVAFTAEYNPRTGNCRVIIRLKNTGVPRSKARRMKVVVALPVYYVT